MSYLTNNYLVELGHLVRCLADLGGNQVEEKFQPYANKDHQVE